MLGRITVLEIAASLGSGCGSCSCILPADGGGGKGRRIEIGRSLDAALLTELIGVRCGSGDEDLWVNRESLAKHGKMPSKWMTHGGLHQIPSLVNKDSLTGIRTWTEPKRCERPPRWEGNGF